MAEAGVAAIERGQPRAQKDKPTDPRVDHNWSDVPPRSSVLQDLIKNLFAHDNIINENQDFDPVPYLPDPPSSHTGEQLKFEVDAIKRKLEVMPYKQTMRNIKLKRVYSTLQRSESLLQ
jgi:hypothetical protein